MIRVAEWKDLGNRILPVYFDRVIHHAIRTTVYLRRTHDYVGKKPKKDFYEYYSRARTEFLMFKKSLMNIVAKLKAFKKDIYEIFSEHEKNIEKYEYEKLHGSASEDPHIFGFYMSYIGMFLGFVYEVLKETTNEFYGERGIDISNKRLIRFYIENILGNLDNIARLFVKVFPDYPELQEESKILIKNLMDKKLPFIDRYSKFVNLYALMKSVSKNTEKKRKRHMFSELLDLFDDNLEIKLLVESNYMVSGYYLTKLYSLRASEDTIRMCWYGFSNEDDERFFTIFGNKMREIGTAFPKLNFDFEKEDKGEGKKDKTKEITKMTKDKIIAPPAEVIK